MLRPLELSASDASSSAPGLTILDEIRYRVVALGALIPSVNSIARAINERGDVTGSLGLRRTPPLSGVSQHAFVYQDGVMRVLEIEESTGSDINNSGEVCGYIETGEGGTFPFLYSGGTVSSLPNGPSRFTLAHGINDNGHITGTFGLAFLYMNGDLLDLGTLGGFSGSVGRRINNSGVIIGTASTSGRSHSRAFLYSGGLMNDLGTLGGTESHGWAVNEQGWVTGSATTRAGVFHAFLYQGEGLRNLGTLAGFDTVGLGINAAGWVVGSARIHAAPGPRSTHAFLHDRSAMHDVNDLLDASASEWEVVQANDINNVGQIVGGAVRSGSGEVTAVLLVPMPCV